MSDSARTEAPAHEPSSIKDAKWWLHKIADNTVPVAIASLIVGASVYQIEEVRYKDITDGLRTQIGTQAATIQGQAATIKHEDATIAQLREQLKGTSPELAAIKQTGMRYAPDYRTSMCKAGNYSGARFPMNRPSTSG